MKLSIASIATSASVLLASIRTVKADGFTPTCICDRRSRLLMGLEPFEEDENGRFLIPSPPDGTAGPPDEDLPDGARPRAAAGNLFEGGQYPACEDFGGPGYADAEGGVISDEAACCECEPGLYVPEAFCCSIIEDGPGDGAPYGPGGQRSLTSVQVRPQGSPSHEDSELLSNDVGIWKLHNFLDEDEVKALKSAFEHASDMYWDCKVDHCRPTRGLAHCQDNPDQESLIQPHGKQCLLVTNDVKAELAAEDALLWAVLTQKYQSIWPEYTIHSPMLAQIQEGETGQFKFHVDGDALFHGTGYSSPVTILLYLTDGGSATYFPKANDGEGVLVTPKAGMALTYYNIDDQGKPLKRALHGVTPSGPEDGVRISIQNKFTYVPDLEEAYW